jgi:hypothetical protein
MFLFKRRKDAPKEKTSLDKTEETIKLAKESKQQKLKQKDGQDASDPGTNRKSDNTGEAVQNDNIPMKVVIPASNLVEDDSPVSAITAVPDKSLVPEEDVDKLLVKVNQGKPEQEAPDISLDILKTEKENAKSTEKPKIQSEQKTDSNSALKNSKPEDTKNETKTETKTTVKPETKSAEADASKDKKEVPKEGKENLFSNLFGKVEVEEDNPLKRLIKSLPDVSMDEVMNESEEVKGLMNEWYTNQGKNVYR